MFLNILLSLVGFAVLIKCADYFVDAASSFALSFRIPATVVGLTIVAFGTSSPELAISFSAHLSGNTDMLFGNVIGSNIANILVILGVAILIKPFRISENVIKKEIPLLLLVTAGVSVLFLDNLFNRAAANTLTRSDGVLLILFFCVFVYYLIAISSGRKNGGGKPAAKPKYKIITSIVIMLIGLAGIIWGSDMVVENVAAFAAAIGISQKVISVTVVSIGTSLPELVTIILASKKGENDMAIGSIVGSNIFNICIVLGLPVVLLGSVTTDAFGVVDISVLLLSVLLLWVFATTGREIRRVEGAAFVAAYMLYGGYVFLQ